MSYTPATAWNNYWNFTTLCNSVYTETARPDLVAETQSAVIAATLTMHSLEFFNRDIQSALLVFDSAAYIQTIDTTVLPRFRKMSYIRKWDPTYYNLETNPATASILPPINSAAGVLNTNLALAFMTIVAVDDVMDQYNDEKPDVAYQVGDTFMMKSSTKFQQANIGWYSYPNTDLANIGSGCPAYSSWIANEFPYAIIYHAAGSVLQKTGENESAAAYIKPGNQNTGDPGGLIAQQISMLRNSTVGQTGY
jgi:hypothetical protein